MIIKKIENKIALLIVFFSFLVDAGLRLKGQSIYFPYIFIILYFILLQFGNIKKEKFSFYLFIIFFYLLFISLKGFYSDTYFFKNKFVIETSFNMLIYVFLDFLILLFIYNFYKGKSILFEVKNIIILLSIITVTYGFLEIINDKNQGILFFFLSLFHTHDTALSSHFYSLFGQEHSYGALSGTILYLFLLSYFYFGNSKNILLFILMIVLLLMVISLQSKGNFISLIIVHTILIFLVLKNQKNFVKKIIFILVVSTILFFVVNYFIENFLPKMTEQVGGSSVTRFNLLLASWNIFLEHPIFGIGLGNFNIFFFDILKEINIVRNDEILAYLDTNDPSGASPNNFVFGLLTETGFIGFIFFMYLFFNPLFTAIKILNDNLIDKSYKTIAMWLLLSMFAIIGSWSGFYTWSFVLWWVILGISYSLKYNYYKKINLRNQ